MKKVRLRKEGKGQEFLKEETNKKWIKRFERIDNYKQKRMYLLDIVAMIMTKKDKNL